MAIGRVEEPPSRDDSSVPRYTFRADYFRADELGASARRDGVDPVPAAAAARATLHSLLQLSPEQVRKVREQVSRRRSRRGRVGPSRDYGAR